VITLQAFILDFKYSIVGHGTEEWTLCV